MASQNSRNPKIVQSNPNSNSSFSSSNPSAPSMYPSLKTKDLAENLFPDSGEQHPTSFESSKEVIVKIPGSIVHLIEKQQQSVELTSGVFEIIRLRQGGNIIAILAGIGTEFQWPLAKDEAAVKLDGSHYFFNSGIPSQFGNGVEPYDLIKYGLTITGKGSEELDRVLEEYSAFSVKEVDREWWWWKVVDRG